MSRVAFEIGPLQVHWYGILLGTAFLASFFLARRYVIKYGISTDVYEIIFIKGIITIIVGARIGFIVANIDSFLQLPWWYVFRIDYGGLGSHGAIIGVMVLGIFWARKYKLSYWQMADAISPCLPLAHILVRTGNFINGELYGVPTDLPWGIQFPGTPGPVHPNQLYEIITSAIILVLALRWAEKPKYHGYAFFRVLFLHSVVRFGLDFIGLQAPVLGPLVLTQVLALGLAVLSLGYIYYFEKVTKKPVRGS